MDTELKNTQANTATKVDMPLQKGTGIWKIHTKKINPEPKHKKLKEPVLFLIRGNYDVEIYENVNEGLLEIERDTGKSKKTVQIMLPKSKILSFPWGSNTLRGWIADEKESVALPTHTLHDSLEMKRITDALITNYKSLETKRNYEGYAKIVWVIGAIIIGAMIVSWFSGIPVWEMLMGEPQTVKVIQVPTGGENVGLP